VTARVTALALTGSLLVGGCAVGQEGRTTAPDYEPTRSVSLEVEPLRRTGRFWQVRLSGSVSSDDPYCLASQEVVIQSRRPGSDRWSALGSGLTDDTGAYSLKLDVRRDEQLRVTVPEYEDCKEVVSSVERLGG
jgi:hypothetical protein